MTPRFAPHLTDDDVRLLFAGDARTPPHADGARQALYLKLRMRVREHLRHAAYGLGDRLEDCVDNTFVMCLEAIAKASRGDLPPPPQTLGWVFASAAACAQTLQVTADSALVGEVLDERIGQLAAALEPISIQQRAIKAATTPANSQASEAPALLSLQRGAGGASGNSLQRLYECVQQQLSEWLRTNRSVQRSANLAMFLRFEFAGLRIKHLHRIYGRSEAAIKQRLSVTRRELKAAVVDCYRDLSSNE